MPRRPEIEPPPHPFLVSKDGGGGLSYWQSRQAKLARPARGLRSPASTADDFIARCAAVQLLLPDEAAFVGATAARVLRLPIPLFLRKAQPESALSQDVADIRQMIEISYPPPVLRKRIRGVRHRQWRPDPTGLQIVEGLRVLSPARTWLDLAAELPLDYHLAVGDHVIRRGLATIEQLHGLTVWAHRRRGVRAARETLALVDPRAESPAESRVRYWCWYHGLPAPEVNAELVINGEWIARVDLLFRGAGVAVEYDGAEHLDERRRRYDARRLNLIQQSGLTVVVLTADDLRNPYAMVQTMCMALHARQ